MCTIDCVRGSFVFGGGREERQQLGQMQWGASLGRLLQQRAFCMCLHPSFACMQACFELIVRLMLASHAVPYEQLYRHVDLAAFIVCCRLLMQQHCTMRQHFAVHYMLLLHLLCILRNAQHALRLPVFIECVSCRLCTTLLIVYLAHDGSVSSACLVYYNIVLLQVLCCPGACALPGVVKYHRCGVLGTNQCGMAGLHVDAVCNVQSSMLSMHVLHSHSWPATNSAFVSCCMALRST